MHTTGDQSCVLKLYSTSRILKITPQMDERLSDAFDEINYLLFISVGLNFFCASISSIGLTTAPRYLSDGKEKEKQICGQNSEITENRKTKFRKGKNLKKKIGHYSPMTGLPLLSDFCPRIFQFNSFHFDSCFTKVFNECRQYKAHLIFHIVSL